MSWIPVRYIHFSYHSVSSWFDVHFAIPLWPWTFWKCWTLTFWISWRLSTFLSNQQWKSRSIVSIDSSSLHRIIHISMNQFQWFYCSPYFSSFKWIYVMLFKHTLHRFHWVHPIVVALELFHTCVDCGSSCSLLWHKTHLPFPLLNLRS